VFFVYNGSTYDLRPLQGKSYQVTMGIFTYAFFPCTNGCEGPSGTPASLCQEDAAGNTVAPVSIFDSTMVWSAITINGQSAIQYTTNNGAPPVCGGSNKPRFATIQFICGQGAETFAMTNEPSLQGCNISPGYVFQLTTPVACAGYVPPSNSDCPYTPQLPCVISTYAQYLWADGLTIMFNANRTDSCGSMVFSDYSKSIKPNDTCTTLPMPNNNVWNLVSYMDTLALPKILDLFNTSLGNVIFFWDPNTNSAAIGQIN